jgi:hypothetical protein
MDILSHRGLWYKKEEKNSPEALRLTFEKGFGTETDFRDFNGQVVISHDVADESCMPARQFFEFYLQHDSSLPLALNVKADGLQSLMADLLLEYEVTNYFFFDMSVPDMLGYIRKGLKSFARLSEYEKEAILYDKIAGIWLDGFDGVWYNPDIIKSHLSAGKKVCVVSEELHGRSADTQWASLKEWGFHREQDFMLCTDLPEKAKQYFSNEK